MGDALDIPAARVGTGEIDGAVWRAGDPVKHLGPPEHLQIHRWGKLFETRCGLKAADGPWQPLAHDGFREDDDYWCVPCVVQAGLAYTIWADDEGPGTSVDDRAAE